MMRFGEKAVQTKWVFPPCREMLLFLQADFSCDQITHRPSLLVWLEPVNDFPAENRAGKGNAPAVIMDEHLQMKNS